MSCVNGAVLHSSVQFHPNQCKMEYMRLYLTLGLMALLWSACQREVPKNETINGVWTSVGSGWIMDIQDSTRYAFYDLTSISCLPNREAGLDEILADLELHGDTLSFLKGVITYKFIRTAALPELCGPTINTEKSKDLLYNFEVFAETVKANYAFMQLNKIDWDALYREQKAKLSTNSTPADLYLLIEETLEKLNDNHAYLEGDADVYAALEQQQADGVEEDTEAVDDLPEYGDFQVADLVSEHYFKEELTKSSWLMRWGRLTDSIGYIQVKSMWLYAKLDIPQPLIEEVGYVDAYVQTFHQMYEGAYIEQEVAGAATIMDSVMQDLSGMSAIVIDVRFNGGGQDAISFEILSRFLAERQRVASQKLWYDGQFSPTLSLFIDGSPEAYTRPVYVLTSPQTGSAAEAFSIATMAIPHIRRIGSATSGAMSTALEKTLPNGWTFSISNEIYMDNQGRQYENVGVPVDFELNYPRDRQSFFRQIANNLEADKQQVLSAIKALE